MKKLVYLAVTYMVITGCSSSEDQGEDVLKDTGIFQEGMSSSIEVVNVFDENIENSGSDTDQSSGIVVIDCADFSSTIEELSDQEKEGLLELDIQLLSDEILRLVNLHRTDLGLTSLGINSTGKLLAIEHNLSQIRENKIGHENFKNRFCPLVHIESAKRVSENTARRQLSADQVVKEWLKSPSHRANIEGIFDEIGIASVKASNGDLYFTQLFIKF